MAMANGTTGHFSSVAVKALNIVTVLLFVIETFNFYPFIQEFHPNNVQYPVQL